MKMKKLLALTLSLLLVLTSVDALAAFNLSDGGTDKDNSELQLIDFDNVLTINSAGAIPVKEHTLAGEYSAYWTHEAGNTTKNNLYFRNLKKSDWSDYSKINISIFGVNTSDVVIGLVVQCDSSIGYYCYTSLKLKDGENELSLDLNTLTPNKRPQNGEPWNRVEYIRFAASGWSFQATPGAEFYINSVSLEKAADGIGKVYAKKEIKSVYSALENGVAVYGGSSQLLQGETVYTYEGADWKDSAVTMIPSKVFSEYLGAKETGADGSKTIKYKDNTLVLAADSTKYTLNGTEGKLSTATYTKNGALYVPAEETARLLGYETKTDKKLVLIGDEKIRSFDSNSVVNNLTEIAAYLCLDEYIDPASITAEQMKEVKDRYRYRLVADENIDTEDEDIKKLIESIERKGKSSWDKLRANCGSTDSLFLTKMPNSTAEMHTEFQNIYQMAMAWAQYGSQYYHDEALKDDILYALKWYYEHRYGKNEIENKGWRDYTLTNWWHWQIGVPRLLLPTLLLMESELTLEQISDYVSFFEFWIESRYLPLGSTYTDGGVNAVHTTQCWLMSSLLTENAENALASIKLLHSPMGWADLQRGGEGMWSDGSYRYHNKHAMNFAYGVDHLVAIGEMFPAIAGTVFDFREPRAENIYDWIFSGYEPLVYDGASFRNVMGRHPTSDRGRGMQYFAALLDLLDAADKETRLRIESMVKYYANHEKVLTYTAGSLTLPQLVKLKKILNDDSIKERDDYYISKVYGRIDKTVHQRKTWALGLSMSSTRMYDYECILNCNLTGWYTGEGMTQLMLENDQKQFYNNYWSKVDPYKYPGTTVDTQQRDAHCILTGNAYVKDYDFVGGVTLNNEFQTAAQQFNAFNLDSDKTQSDGSVIKAHHSTLNGKKAWFMFDDEVVCLGTGINANDGFDVRTIVENRLSNNVVSTIPESETTPSYEIVGVEASQEPQEENVKENTLDGNYLTKWAAEGAADITWDLGEIKTVGFVGLSFMSGNKRTQKIDISLSEDGENWTEVFAGNTGGTTEGQELFDCKNLPARYVKMGSYGNSAGSGWVSLTTVSIYQPSANGEIKVFEPKYLGAEKVTVNGSEISVTDKEKSLDGALWVHLENTGGYYFPQGGSITANRTSSDISFFELWLNHGISPKNAQYAYVLLPTMTADETAEYAQNPDIQIMCNTDSIQAVRDKSTGAVGIVFWEAGSYGGITVDKPMIVMHKETDGKMTVSVSDPTQKLTEANITFGKTGMKADTLDWRASYSEDNGKLTINFANCGGGTVENVLTLPSGESGESNENNGSGGSGSSGGGGGGGTVSKPDKADNSNTGSDNAGADTDVKNDSKPTKVTFRDVPNTYWAYAVIEELSEKGIISGNGNKDFLPENPVTREEFVKMLIETFDIKKTETDAVRFDDASSGEWYDEYIYAAASNGIVNGIGGGKFGIGRRITRQDMCVMLSNALKLTEKAGKQSDADFADNDDIADYAKDAVLMMKAMKIVSGYEDGRFKPTADATRAEAAQILMNALKAVEK